MPSEPVSPINLSLEEALSEASLRLLKSLKNLEMQTTLTEETLRLLWPASISLAVRGFVVHSILKKNSKRILFDKLKSKKDLEFYFQQFKASHHQSSQIFSWLKIWVPQACKVLAPYTLMHLRVGDFKDLFESSHLPKELSDLVPELCQAYEHVIAHRIILSDHSNRYELIEGGLRQDHGSYYTPTWLISHMLDATINQVAQRKSPSFARPLILLDPSCGVGSFLVQGVMRQAELIKYIEDQDYQANLALLISQSLYGVDLDPHAIELCRTWLWTLGELNEEESSVLSTHIRYGDALLEIPPYHGHDQDPLSHWRLSFPERVFEDRISFDVIVGNPPYIDSEQMKRLYTKERSLLCQRFESCKGNWDLFVPFIELSLRLLAPNGAQAMVTPKQLISSDYATSIQALLLKQELKQIIDCRRCKVFADADVEVLVLVAEKTDKPLNHDVQVVLYEPIPDTPQCLRILKRFPQAILEQLPPGHWSFALHCAPTQETLFKLWSKAGKLTKLVNISDGATTNEAYLIKELLYEASSASDEAKHLLENGLLRFVNTGLIDPFECFWGQRSARYLKSDWDRPVLSLAQLQKRFPKRAEQALQNKIVIAGLARRIEALVVPCGTLCGKSARQLIPLQKNVCLYAICALLNSQLIHQLYGALFGLRGLSRSWSLGSRQLANLPVPSALWLTPYQGPKIDQDFKISEKKLVRMLKDEPYQGLSLLGQVLHQWPHDPRLHRLLEQMVMQSFEVTLETA